MDLVLVGCSNNVSILHHFSDVTTFVILRSPPFLYRR